MTTGVRLHFSRLGSTRREHDVEFPDVDIEEPPDVIEAVRSFARRHLLSSTFFVHLDFDTGTGSIEAGRFGEFTFEAMT